MGPKGMRRESRGPSRLHRSQRRQPLDQQKQEVEGLRALRRIVGKGQAEVASALKIKQPSVSKIEGQSDMYLSTLRSYVEAIGGRLELTVIMPAGSAVAVQRLGRPDRQNPGSNRNRHLGKPPQSDDDQEET